MAIRHVGQRGADGTVGHAAAAQQKFDGGESADIFARQDLAIADHPPAGSAASTASATATSIAVTISVDQLAIIARVCRGDLFTNQSHHIFGDRLDSGEMGEFFGRFLASVDNPEIGIVDQFDFGLLEMPSENLGQRAIHRDAIDTMPADQLHRRFGGGGFAIGRQSGRRRIFGGARDHIDSPGGDGAIGFQVSDQSDAALTDLDPSRRITQTDPESSKQGGIGFGNTGHQSGFFHLETWRVVDWRLGLREREEQFKRDLDISVIVPRVGRPSRDTIGTIIHKSSRNYFPNASMSASVAPTQTTKESAAAAFFIKHEFVIRRLHSLLGIVPLGLYMVVHLTANASLLNGGETFQWAVFLIHSPGKLLPLIEWGLILLPLIFHAGIGVWIAKTGVSNTDRYKFTNNRRYTWQRYSGVLALVYLFAHVLHLHGWFHSEWWLGPIRELGFGAFRPYNAASTLAAAMQGVVWPAFYLVGMLACVYHLANGLWTAGITWGLWISDAAQARATKLCVVIGLALAVLGTSAWWAAVAPGEKEIAEFAEIENRMYDAAAEAGMVPDMPEKRSAPNNQESE